MRFQVTGKHIDIGSALQTHVEDQLTDVVTKYAQRPTDAHVVFSKSGSEYMCEVLVHLSTGLSVQATAKSHEIYAAFDAAATKMEKQLRRYKRRLKDHHKVRETPVEQYAGASYILETATESDPEPETLQPIIVAEMEHSIRSLSVGEAVMQMELAGSPFLVFKKEEGAEVNVVYKRDDGNIGWIDTAR